MLTLNAARPAWAPAPYRPSLAQTGASSPSELTNSSLRASAWTGRSLINVSVGFAAGIVIEGLIGACHPTQKPTTMKSSLLLLGGAVLAYAGYAIDGALRPLEIAEYAGGALAGLGAMGFFRSGSSK